MHSHYTFRGAHGRGGIKTPTRSYSFTAAGKGEISITIGRTPTTPGLSWDKLSGENHIHIDLPYFTAERIAKFAEELKSPNYDLQVTRKDRGFKGTSFDLIYIPKPDTDDHPRLDKGRMDQEVRHLLVQMMDAELISRENVKSTYIGLHGSRGKAVRYGYLPLSGPVAKAIECATGEAADNPTGLSTEATQKENACKITLFGCDPAQEEKVVEALESALNGGALVPRFLISKLPCPKGNLSLVCAYNDEKMPPLTGPDFQGYMSYILMCLGPVHVLNMDEMFLLSDELVPMGRAYKNSSGYRARIRDKNNEPTEYLR